MAKQNRTILKGYFETGDIPSQEQYADLIDSKLNLSDSETQILEGGLSASFLKTENNLIVGTHITASGNISASSDLEVGGDAFVSQFIKHTGDVDTRINFMDNKIQLEAGGIAFIQMDKDSSTPFPLTVNSGGNRINFRVMDRNTELLLKTDSEASKVNLYHAGNQKLETVANGINITGSISASGNISSSSGTGSFGSLQVDGSSLDFTNLPTSDPGIAGRLYNDSGTVKISAG